MLNDTPTVSVIVPCRNEKDHIDICIRSVLNQTIPHEQIEFIVVDGMSDDGTRKILQQFMTEDSRLKVIDNFQQITPCARNIGIRAARGKYIAILDAHTEYSASYVGTCIDLLEEHSEICCAGGPIISIGRSAFGRAIAAAMSHPIGVGNAKHRFPEYEGYAEGACFPVFRKEIFDKIGLFDEGLVRNQDDDFNFRVSREGEKIFLSPRAQCTYYVRETPNKLFWQFFYYGYYRVLVLRKHRLPISYRHFAPIAFFSSLIIMPLVSLFLPSSWGFIGYILPLLYGGILGLGGVSVALKEGFLVGLMFPLVASLMHLAYACGFAGGVGGVFFKSNARGGYVGSN